MHRIEVEIGVGVGGSFQLFSLHRPADRRIGNTLMWGMNISTYPHFITSILNLFGVILILLCKVQAISSNAGMNRYFICAAYPSLASCLYRETDECNGRQIKAPCKVCPESTLVIL
jgi:hypothetical protein